MVKLERFKPLGAAESSQVVTEEGNSLNVRSSREQRFETWVTGSDLQGSITRSVRCAVTGQCAS